MPHLGVDPVMTAVQIAQALQTIITRNRHPLEAAILSITQIHAGSADNVIPTDAIMAGTVRTFTIETLDLIEKRMREIMKSNQPFIRSEVSVQEALAVFSTQPYKCEIIERVTSGSADGSDVAEVCSSGSVSLSNVKFSNSGWSNPNNDRKDSSIPLWGVAESNNKWRFCFWAIC